MMTAPDDGPSGTLGLAPYLYFEDAGQALDWYARVFGFREDVRYVDPDGVVAEAEMLAGTTRVLLSGGHDPRPDSGRGQQFVVYVDDVASHNQRVLAAGIEAEEPRDMPYAARVYTITDPWAYAWTFWQSTGDMALGEGWREIKS